MRDMNFHNGVYQDLSFRHAVKENKLFYRLTLKKEALHASETSLSFYQSMRCKVSEGLNRHTSVKF